MLRPHICVCVVSVSTCPGTEAWDRWPLTHSGDSKSEASASFVKTAAVSCTTCCTLASLRAYRRVGGGLLVENTTQVKPQPSHSLNCSQLSSCRKHLATRSQVTDTGSKPMGSEQGAFPTRPKELEMVMTKHLARTAPGCRNSGVFFQSRHGMTDVRRWQGPGKDLWLWTPHPMKLGSCPQELWTLQSCFPHWLWFLRCFLSISDRSSEGRAPNTGSFSLPEPQPLSRVLKAH